MAPILRVRKRDGTILEDISSIAFDKSATRRLANMGECTFRVPSYLVSEIQDDGYPLITRGRRQIELVTDFAGLYHHGVIWTLEDEGDADMAYTRVTSYTPRIYWRYRPVRNGVNSIFNNVTNTYRHSIGDFSDPDIIARNRSGPQIIEEALFASENTLTNGGTEGPDNAEGQLMMDLAASSFAVGGADLRGAPTDYPMSIEDLVSLLESTGEVDCVETPIIGSVGLEGFQNLATLAVYNGNFGRNLTGVAQTVKNVVIPSDGYVHFDYATGSYNVANFRRSEDMTIACNKLWDYLGQREDLQHWHANVTGSAFGPFSIFNTMRPPGGESVDSLNDPVGPPWTDNQLGEIIYNSRQAFGVLMLIGVYDNFGSEQSAFELYARLWQIESFLRANGREMVYITPTSTSEGETPPGDVFLPGDFDIGDLIEINMGAKSRIAESGASRVYAITINIDDDGVESIGELETSPDQNAA